MACVFESPQRCEPVVGLGHHLQIFVVAECVPYPFPYQRVVVGQDYAQSSQEVGQPGAACVALGLPCVSVRTTHGAWALR